MEIGRKLVTVENRCKPQIRWSKDGGTEPERGGGDAELMKGGGAGVR